MFEYTVIAWTRPDTPVLMGDIIAGTTIVGYSPGYVYQGGGRFILYSVIPKDQL